ncbi:MAG: hypothetical protein KKD39_08760, partial [Candidatus Altiarchaeota archaeon]|nr:hypothetical protein [Candidatus Altiarchaeota archaeon]
MPETFQTVPLQVKSGEKPPLTPKQQAEFDRFEIRRMRDSLLRLLRPEQQEQPGQQPEDLSLGGLTQKITDITSQSQQLTDLGQSADVLSQGTRLSKQIQKARQEHESETQRRQQLIGLRVQEVQGMDADIQTEQGRLSRLQPPGLLNVVPNLFRYLANKRQIELAHMRKARVERDKASVQADIDAMGGEVQEMKSASENSDKVMQAFTRRVSNVSQNMVSSIASSHVSLGTALCSDDQLKQQMDDRLLQTQLDPVLAGLVESGAASEEDARQYRLDIRNGIRDGFSSDWGQSEEFRQEVNARWTRLEAFKNSLSYEDQRPLESALWVIGARGSGHRRYYDDMLRMLVGEHAMRTFEELGAAVSGSDMPEETKANLAASLEDAKGTKHEGTFHRFDLSHEGVKGINGLLEHSSQRWDVLSTDNTVLTAVGTESVEGLRGRLSQRIVENLMTAKEHVDETIHLGYHFLQFHRTEDIPFLLMNFFREPGYSGERPFVSIHSRADDTTAYQFASGLTPEQLQQLRGMNVPGLMDVIGGIKENATPATDFRHEHPQERWTALVEAYDSQMKPGEESSFVGLEEIRKMFVEPPAGGMPSDMRGQYLARLKVACEATGNDFEQSRKAIEEGKHYGSPDIPNPGYQRVQQGLGQMCLHYMAEGTDPQRIYILGLLEDLDEQYHGGIDKFEKILQDTRNEQVEYAVVSRLSNMCSWRHKPEAAMVLLRNSEKPGLEYQLKGHGDAILKNVLSLELDGDNLRRLSK